MRHLMLLSVLFIAFVQIQCQSRPKPYDENANAEQDIQAALSEARNNGKLVLLEFGANW